MGGLSKWVGLPAEAAEGLWHSMQAIPLHNEDLELPQSLNVLRQVLQTVGGQVEEHLQEEKRR